jgi:hypothetical protein
MCHHNLKEKMMKFYTQTLLLIVAMFMCGVSFAGIDKDDLGDFNTLTPTQKASIISRIAQAKERNGPSTPAVSTPKELKEWAEVGSAVGKGLVATAKELGVEVNAFAQTGVGKLAIVLIVWKVMGGDILHIFGGIAWVMIALPMWIYFFRKLCVVKEIKYNEKGKKESIVHYVGKEAECARITMTIALVFIVVIGLVTIFSY